MKHVSAAQTSGDTDGGRESAENRFIHTITASGWRWWGALVAGAGLLAGAARAARKRRGRAVLLAAAGLALLGIGLRRRATRGDAGMGGPRGSAESEEAGSAEAHAETVGDLGAGRTADESRQSPGSETPQNPRGAAGSTDEEAAGEGIDFIEGREPGTHSETTLADEAAQDTRLSDKRDDERTEVDLSEAAVADETSEAAGPRPEQAYPAREGTDPEPTSPRAPEGTRDAGEPAAEDATGADEATPEDRDEDDRSAHSAEESSSSDPDGADSDESSGT